MTRREAIQHASLVLGYAISAPAIGAVLNGCKAAPDLAFKPIFFSKEQAVLVSELSEIILPKTTTPGAKDAGVPGFIDSLLGEVYSQEDRNKFINGLSEFDAEAEKTYGNKFVDCDHEEQISLFKKHHDEAITKSAGDGPTGWWNSGAGADKPFVMKIKELTILGFFTSELGATKVLQYNQVPGPFQGCVPLTQVGKAWAT